MVAYRRASSKRKVLIERKSHDFSLGCMESGVLTSYASVVLYIRYFKLCIKLYVTWVFEYDNIYKLIVSNNDC